MCKMAATLLKYLAILICINDAIDSVEGELESSVRGRVEYFLMNPYFVGLPDLNGNVEIDDQLDTDIFPGDVDLLLQDRIKLNRDDGSIGARSSSSGKPSDDAGDTDTDQWPGRHDTVNLTDAAGSVAKVFKENLRLRLSEANNSASDSGTDKTKECDEKCKSVNGFLRKSLCAVECLIIDNKQFKDNAREIVEAVESYCRAMDTVFGKFNELGITSLEQMQALASSFPDVLMASRNIPWRALLIKFIRTVPSPIQTLEPMVTALEEALKPIKDAGTKDRLLVGENAGCAQIGSAEAIGAAVEAIGKNPALMDYLFLQGYAVMDAVTKYVNEFPTKKIFASQHLVYDMMMGTTCGLYLYGSKMEVINCDQYGGYPNIDLPVPEYLWKDEAQANCEKIREQLLLNGSTGEAPSPAKSKPNEPKKVDQTAKAKPAKGKSRRKRTLLVGQKKVRAT